MPEISHNIMVNYVGLVICVVTLNKTACVCVCVLPAEHLWGDHQPFITTESREEGSRPQ